MTSIWTWEQMAPIVGRLDLVAAMEHAFAAYSEGKAVIPPVGELQFTDPPGDVHLKYGYLRGEAHYVVKIASGFYDNPALGLSSSDGLMLLFDQRTGTPVAVLLDRGRLTDLRTAAAGAVAAKHLASERIDAVGVLGAGIQARLQIEALEQVTTCRRVRVWARRGEAALELVDHVAARGWQAEAAPSVADLAASCRLIVTTTPSEAPLLTGEMVRPGTHITAVGADTPSKRELDTAAVRRADVIVADSLSQCATRGELARAGAEGADLSTAVELGDVVAGRARGRQHAEQITLADLTGVAVQDLAIAEAVHRALVRATRPPGDGSAL